MSAKYRPGDFVRLKTGTVAKVECVYDVGDRHPLRSDAKVQGTALYRMEGPYLGVLWAYEPEITALIRRLR